MLFLILGVVLGAVAMLLPVYRARRQTERLEEEKQQVSQERQQVVDFMHHMVEALGEGLSPQDLHQRVVHAAILCSGALSACLFVRADEREMRTAAVEGLFPPHRPLDARDRAKLATRAKFIEQVLRVETFPDNEGVVGAVIQTGRGQLIADAAADPRVVRHEDPALKVRSVIAVPLQFRDRFFGVLAVANSADGEPFTETDFSLMQSLAEQAALALHNAEFLHFQLEKRQLDMDLSLASGIQQMLLPDVAPLVNGLDVDARYLPAQKVGGDFYDVFALDEERLGVAVADVSGKGIPASLLMAICRTNLRQIAPRHRSPAAALSELNRALGDGGLRGMFITLVYAIVDGAKGEIVLARAGHELPLFARGGGAVRAEFVASEGMPLGMVPDELFSAVIEDRREPFGPGDVLLLYTDGITETPDENEQEFSGQRLAETLRTVHALSAAEINESVLESVRRFAGEATAQRDDLTLVTVKRD